MIIIRVHESNIKEFLYDKIDRANRLYHMLFLEKYNINRKSDAEEYIKLYNEYDGIVDMLRELQMYNWLNVELNDRNDIEIV